MKRILHDGMGTMIFEKMGSEQKLKNCLGFFSVLLLTSFVSQPGFASNPENTNAAAAPVRLVLGVIDRSPKAEFDEKSLPFFQDQMKRCDRCEIRNLSVYDPQGVFQLEKLAENLDKNARGISILLLNWNERATESNKALVETLRALSSQGVIIVGASGFPRPDEAAGPLNKTILGQVPDALIIGERNERDRLVGVGFFGPEMLTAVRPPKELMGQGITPALFATRLATQWQKKKPEDWISAIKGKKSSSRKLWLDIEDFFGRN